MTFKKTSQQTASDQLAVHLPTNSLLVMSKEVRYDYTHEISKNREDSLVTGEKIQRGRRVALIFRTIADPENVPIVAQPI
jgi:hypothetical protein